MKRILLFLLAASIITLSGITSGYSTETKQSSVHYSNEYGNGDVYVYEHVYLDGKHFVYVYQGDLLIDVYEVEE